MRKHRITRILLRNEDNHSCPEANEQTDGRCAYHSKLTLSGSSPFVFTDTDFIRCSNNGNGGAISFQNQVSGILTVSRCAFYSCTCTTSGSDDGNGGGAIYANNIAKVTIFATSFLSCACYSLNGCDGGAIELWKISSQPMITDCHFILCHADDDGGAVSIWNSSATNTVICTDCRFLSCSVPDDNTVQLWPWAGGIMLWNNNNILRFSNILFVENKGYYGGAFATNSYGSSPNYLLTFCFFTKNSGTFGNDVGFAYFQPSNTTALFLCCYSTSASKRVCYYYDPQYYITDVVWLPQTNSIIKVCDPLITIANKVFIHTWKQNDNDTHHNNKYIRLLSGSGV